MMKITLADEAIIAAAKHALRTPEKREALTGREFSFLDALVRSWDATGNTALTPNVKRTAYSMLEAHDWLDYND